MAKLSSVQQFGENWLRALQFEKEMSQRQEEFNREMGFKKRQFDFLSNIQTQQLNLDRLQEDRLREQAKGDFIREGFRPVQEGLVEGRENIRTKEFETQEPIFKFLDEKFAYPLPKPTEPITQSRLKPFGQGGLYEEQFIQTPEGEAITGYESIFSPDRSNGGGSGANTPEPFVEKPLQEWQVQEGLNMLQNPTFTKQVKSGDKVEDVKLSPEELKVNLDDAVNNLASGYLDSSTRQWLSDLEKQYGRYPNPDELRDEIVQSGEAKELTEDQLRRLSSFLNVYYQSYGGVNQMQRRIINPKSFNLE